MTGNRTNMTRRFAMAAMVAGSISATAFPGGRAAAASAAEIDAAADAALRRLLSSQPVTDAMLADAKGVMIFPKIVKAGLLVGAAGGEGVLRINGASAGYFRSTAVSYGLQAGVTKFGYIMLLMDDASLAYVRDSAGWEVGVGPTVTIADENFLSSKFSTTTEQSGIYVFFINQKGYFAGAGIEGTKISRIAN